MGSVLRQRIPNRNRALCETKRATGENGDNNNRFDHGLDLNGYNTTLLVSQNDGTAIDARNCKSDHRRPATACQSIDVSIDVSMA
jgi:hypothetical protein